MTDKSAEEPKSGKTFRSRLWGGAKVEDKNEVKPAADAESPAKLYKPFQTTPAERAAREAAVRPASQVRITSCPLYYQWRYHYRE